MPLPSQRTGPNGELPEFPLRGPFGGIQSELPPEMIETLGFLDTQNIMFRKARARVRPATEAGVAQPKLVRIEDLIGLISEQTWTPAGGFPPDYPGGGFEPWMMIADFYAKDGNRLQCAVTASRLFYYDNHVWHLVPGDLRGTITDPFSWTIVGGILCFCNGVDKVKTWNGLDATFNDASPDAVPARFLFELANHLVACNTIESGQDSFQRVRWTGAGDPSDWTSFNAGQVDLFNDLGPIRGGLKLFQYGYIFQKDGIVQMIPTGLGLNPFDFVALSAKSKGLLCPKSLCANGDTMAYYVGTDNVYSFDGTNNNPIGDMPNGGGDPRMRLGARSRIFADLATVDLNSVLGFVTTSINGNPYNAYWLIIPGQVAWIYNIDEGNWTRWTFDATVSAIGNFAAIDTVRIMDLIGTIADQTWSPATLVTDVPFDCIMLGMSDSTVELFKFNGWSEMPFYITTGWLSYGDTRHEAVTKAIRLIYQDQGPVRVQMKLVNELGQQQINTKDQENYVPMGGINVGTTQQKVIPVSIPGEFVQITFSGQAGNKFNFTLLSPKYSPSGEVTR